MSSLMMRSLRSVLSARRLAVRLATQRTPSSPAPNVRRALQTSSASPSTLTAFAWISSGSPPTSISNRSRSWIIMSSTTPTSTLRKVMGLTRSISMNRGVRFSSRRIATMTGSYRTM